MATDATGTPTSLGIPTFNVDSDAPSGLGFNAAMAEINTLLAARIAANGTAVDGDPLIWDSASSTWKPVSVKINDATKVLHGDGSWSTADSASKNIYDSGVLATAATTIDSGTLTIPSWANHLRAVIRARSTAAATSEHAVLNFNGDTGAHYAWSIPSVSGQAADTAGHFAVIAGSSTVPASLFTDIELRLSFAFNTAYNKNWTAAPRGGDHTNLEPTLPAVGGTWFQTAAISSIKVAANVGNLAAGCRMMIYAEA